jgi:hypothetical protein
MRSRIHIVKVKFIELFELFNALLHYVHLESACCLLTHTHGLQCNKRTPSAPAMLGVIYRFVCTRAHTSCMLHRDMYAIRNSTASFLHMMQQKFGLQEANNRCTIRL